MPSRAQLTAWLRKTSGSQTVAVTIPGLGSATGASVAGDRVLFWAWGNRGDAWHRVGSVPRWDFNTDTPQTLRGAYLGNSRTAVFVLTGGGSTGSSPDDQVFAQQSDGTWGVVEKVAGGVGAVPAAPTSADGHSDPVMGLWFGTSWDVEAGTLTLTDFVLPPDGTTAGGHRETHTYRTDGNYRFVG